MNKIKSKIKGHEHKLSAHIMSAFSVNYSADEFDIKTYGSVDVTEIKVGEHKGFYDNFYEDGETYFMPA